MLNSQETTKLWISKVLAMRGWQIGLERHYEHELLQQGLGLEFSHQHWCWRESKGLQMIGLFAHSCCFQRH